MENLYFYTSNSRISPTKSPNQICDMENTTLQVGRESYQVLIESIRDYAIFFVDADGFVVDWNKGAEEIKGYSANEVLGKHISVFYLKEENETGEPQRNLQMAKKLGQFEEEAWRVRKDGSTFWADIVITALKNEKGELAG